eukprot:CAMPEP_0201607736 /NCGR_PEP_ID=MMETSP0492-20130828/6748_1 /ASSEMBLY_ACC=CAM_ASM_000837 /TAXON_ID=420259 /ORGANISM="Thalassiosira gravida, Strain GMp14c1" /LENGTH=50 /DNA_ID=CAMNT_0048072389 /DNA_START=214 /DNA_END=363 /DNA_ORIENTATION=+
MTMYLPEDKWSPRYDEQFYTIRMKNYTTLHTRPAPPSQEEATSSNDNHPI